MSVANSVRDVASVSSTPILSILKDFNRVTSVDWIVPISARIIVVGANSESMDESTLREYLWDRQDERAMVLLRFCDRDELLEIGQRHGISWFNNKQHIGFNEEVEAADKVSEEMEGDQLEDVLNETNVESPSPVSWFAGQHYDVTVDDGRVIIENKSADKRHDTITNEIKQLAAGDKYVSPLLRGILLSGSDRGDYLRTDFSDATAEGGQYYDDNGAFHPSNKAGLPGQITGMSTRSGSNTGRTYRVVKEAAPIIWQALEAVDEETATESDPVETPGQEVPSEFARRIPKFEKVFEDVELTETNIKEFESILKNNDAIEYWKDYVAPRVKFRDTAKEAILCMLAAPEDKYGNKGRTNAIFYGPPGTGKTVFKNFLTEKFGAYSIDGARVSKVDLTYNKNTGEDGLLVRAHKGLAVIEEADEMDDDALGAALTALGESGTVEIRDMQLPAEVRGVMLGNYRSKEDIIRQHGEALFNRFEFVIKFEQMSEEELDETLDWHYQFFRKPKPNEDAERLKKYLKWVRSFKPEVPDDELQAIMEYKREHLDDIGNVREGNALMNVAYTLARLNHRDVTLEDFESAHELMNT